MPTAVAFLRGINVGAHNRMPMDALSEVFESLGYVDVRTYIQSGNVVFETDATDGDDLEATIEAAIDDAFGYDVTVMVRTLAELEAIVERQPFDEPADDGTKRYVAFLAEEPGDEQIAALLAAATAPETFVVVGREVYSELRTAEMERGRFTDAGTVLGVPATRRTWDVVTSVLELASS